jgi:hypothetical protein
MVARHDESNPCGSLAGARRHVRKAVCENASVGFFQRADIVVKELKAERRLDSVGADFRGREERVVIGDPANVGEELAARLLDFETVAKYRG